MSTVPASTPIRSANARTPRRAPAQAARPAAFAGVLRSAFSTPLLAILFIASLLIPTELSIYLGDTRLTIYRLLLIGVLLPGLLLVYGGRRGSVTIIDLAMLFYAGWSVISLMVNHDIVEITQSAGITFIESLAPYLLARVCIKTVGQARSLGCLLIVVCCGLAFVTIPESVTGNHFIKTISSRATGGSFYSDIEPRFGFHRAFGPFDHPILYGVFASSVFTLAWFLSTKHDRVGPRRIMWSGGVLAAAFASVSSGAIIAAMMQFILIIYERFSRTFPHRWILLGAGFLSMYLAIDMISNRSGIKVLLAYMTLNPGTAYGRMIIWEFGFAALMKNPLFGIGYHDWDRPAWLASSVDNFWLLIGMRHGFPALLALLVAVIVSLARTGRAASAKPQGTDSVVRMAFVISMMGIIVAAATVHLWNSLFVYFIFLIGAMAPLTRPPQPERPRAAPPRVRAARPAPSPPPAPATPAAPGLRS